MGGNPLSHSYTTMDVTHAFLDNFFKSRRLPNTVTSDRDPTFLSNIWNEFFKLQGVSLSKSIAYIHNSHGQTENVNKCIWIYLKCMCSYKAK